MNVKVCMYIATETTANAAVSEPTATRHPGYDDIPKETPEKQFNL